MEEILQEVEADIYFVDLHGEATSEKIALGYYLAGKVTAVLGTHTHVPTADERIVDEKTAYIYIIVFLLHGNRNLHYYC